MSPAREKLYRSSISHCQSPGVQADDRLFKRNLNSVNDGRSRFQARRKISSQLDIDTKDGISLLSLKHHLMLSYLQSLALTSAHRVLGHNISDRSSSTRQPFNKVERAPRGSQPGDLIDSMIENRVVLEKVSALENKMRYQVEKLVRLAEETPEEAQKSVVNDPLAFRPNPQNLMNQNSESSESEIDSDDDTQDKANDGIYRPPKLAPMPYNEETSRSKKERRKPVTSALSQISMGAYNPYVETTTGLGGTPSLASSRARELARMTEYEEENFTRLVMKKKDEKRRRRDEEDLALGGTGAALTAGPRGRGQRGVGLEDEFADVFKSVNRRKDGTLGDGYEELRQRGGRAMPFQGLE
ncbi:protein related to LCP5-U3 small nucleolar ribonucleo involved in maturation of 18S rRNA [Pyrrhoderma noxium]|uniref:Protein related to LCP5-U3 small nucleolar ribonucleo involved in maturation of 18S rRNA n=1 Tax=Pyrrhoderma noxium TaxID=2282107 RepID=A0A286UUM2_9AGAM|nr:protein related to LCP5-U3 small nucleolar ribonucleo involved in maturation of 18S rRNA [Pyrrhoderma noxium]